MKLRTTGTIRRILGITLLASLVAACSSGPSGVRVVNGGGSSSTSSKPRPEQIRNFSSPEIHAAIVGKTFQYTRADGNGFLTYNSDGTFDYQDDVKGTGKGRWTVNGSQFCETFGAGAATDCGEFKTTGDAYFAAKSRLVEMKV
jgi:hypothetical protein